MTDIYKKLNTEPKTKIKIFQVAAKLFSEKGYNGVSMREISEKSKVSKPTIYYYFGSKEGIFKELLEVGLKYGTEKSLRIIETDIPVKGKLIKLMQNRFRLSLEHPEFSKFFLAAFITSETIPFVNNYKKHIATHQKLLIDLIKEGVTTGEFGAGANPELATEIIGAVISHFIRRQLKSHKKILNDELAEQIVELLFKGLNE